MGKVSKVFGVGVKGVLEVLLPRDAYNPGDAVEGFVALRVTKPVECKELVLLVEGTERLVYWEEQGDSATKRQHTNDLLHETIVLSTQGAYEPGEYMFGFSYQLPDTLPASFAVSRRRATLMDCLSASTTYSLKATLAVTTGFSADLEGSRPIAIVPPSLAQPVRSVSEQSSKTIRTMGLVSRGECELSATMDQDACVAGDMLRVKAAVSNQTSADVSCILVKLNELLTTLVGPESSDCKGTKCVCEAKMPGIGAGQRHDLVLSLPLISKKNRQPVNPTTLTGSFVHWEYELVIQCKFAMASSVEVKMPVVVLPQAQVAGEQVACAVAVAATALDADPFFLKKAS